MDNSIYITLSRQMGLFRDLEVTANNIANVNTPGYNAEKLMFQDYMVQDAERENAFVRDPMSYRDTSNGAIKVTNNTLDFAINGSGYFQVQTPLGVRYTRAGNFTLDAVGTLVNADGYPVLGSDGGEIVIPENARNVLVNGAGQINVDGEDVGQIGVMEFENEQAMTRLGNSLYTSEEDPLPSETARLAQGAIETSNVNSVSELVRVMSLSRANANTAKFIEVMYDLERKTSSTYARMQS